MMIDDGLCQSIYLVMIVSLWMRSITLVITTMTGVTSLRLLALSAIVAASAANDACFLLVLYRLRAILPLVATLATR